MRIAAITAMVLAGCSSVFAQQVETAQPGVRHQVFDRTVAFISALETGEGSLVTGAAYSANSVTETIQTLGDGNRIIRRISSFVARDHQGRTRRDQALDAVGPWTPGGNAPPPVSFITDPVAKTQFVLEHETRTARQLPFIGQALAGTAVGTRVAVPENVMTFEWNAASAAGPGAVVGFPATRVMIDRPAEAYETRTESLGTQVIQGVTAEGLRRVTTIPAGAIGNERPIEIVSETWYAPSLQLMVLTRNSDPRFGETTYRLENLSTIEPVASLFEVPRDYSLVGPADRPLR